MIWAADAMQAEKNILAEDLLTQSIVLMPNYAEAWNRRATLYYAMGKIGDSVSDIERVLELEPRHFGALSGLGMILQQSSQDRKALEIWRRVLAIYPSSEQAQKAVIELEEELAGQDA
jgi:tetratricopeptide (TPR) repeat protein